MHCPLIFSSLKPIVLTESIKSDIYVTDDATTCLEAGCAWWDTEEERCAILGLSLDMINIRESLDDIARSIIIRK